MSLLAALLGATFAAGLWLAVTSREQPAPRVRAGPTAKQATAASDHRRRIIQAVGLAMVAGVLTRWPVAAIAGAVLGWWWQDLAGGNAERERQVARTEAIATWAEMLRDTLAGAHGLEETIAATAVLAPPAIRTEVAALAARVEREPLVSALAGLAGDLAHPVGDLVVAALQLAAGGSARDLGELLSSLATAARDEAAMRLRVEAARARLRTAVRVIAGCTLITAAGLIVLNPSYVNVYTGPAGQVVLALLAGGAGLCLWWLAGMTRFLSPERFVADPSPAEEVVR